MSGSEREHFAADQDALERFVLQRMSEEEQATAQAHLETCPACRRAVEEERLLALAVRTHARVQVKARLRRALDTERRGLPWPHILAAAAVLVIITGIGLFAGWLELFIQPSPPVHTDSPASTVLQQEAPPPAPAEEQTAGKAEPEGKSAKRSLPSSGIAPSPDEEKSKEAQVTDRRESERPAATPREQAREEDRLMDGGARSYGSAQHESLVFGQVTLTPGYRESEEKVGTLDRTFKSRAETQAMKNEQRQLPGRVQTQQVHVQLQPRMLLARTNPDVFRDSTQVPTLLDQHGDTLLLMPFVNDVRDSNKVSVEMPTLDSIVVKMPGRMIGYRVPAQFQRQR